MNCAICHRAHHAQKLPFYCAVDARNRLYEHRVANAVALMENEQLEQQISSALSDPKAAAAESPSGKSMRVEGLMSEEAQSADRTAQIIAQADKLRAEVDAARKEIEERKRAIARKKSDLVEASSGIAARRSRQLDDTERAIQMSRYKWNRKFETMAATRSYLCMEAARLYGLRRIKKGSSVKYELGGVDMIELPAMSSASPEALSTSLGHIAHILMLASHYLAIRLPAEITLPHRDYPRPTIFSLSSSYQHGDVPFPGSAIVLPNQQQDTEEQHIPRPRPLFIDRPLPALAKEDPSVYSLFIEGVILLAYDIAWACCSQGVPIGDKTSYEDVCNISRNLYNLLVGNQLVNNPAGRLAQAPSPQSSKASEGNPAEINGAKPLMGRYSHGTVHTNLGSAEGHEFVRTFKLPNPVKLADRLKKKMLSEAATFDWEMLDDEAWTMDDNMEEGVLSKGKRPGEPSRRLFGVESVASTRTALDGTIVGIRSSRWAMVSAPRGQGPPAPANGQD